MGINMQILVDADACPVLDIIVNVSENNDLKLKVYTDITHDLTIDYGKIIKIDKGNQAVDMAILNNCGKGDIIVTGDYGLAALVLGKDSYALDFNGRVYDDKNIDYLLMKRHIRSKIRRGGGRHKGPVKRTEEDNINFKNSLIDIIKKRLI
jgi:uncharacterized protein YaiI (UPF0178 family)